MGKRKATDSGNQNSEFCDFLTELADYEKNVNKNIHKYNAYRKAAEALAGHDKKITSGEEARKIHGIGKQIEKKIDEFIQTGKLRKLENIRVDDKAQAIKELTRVTGIGPSKAATLVDMGIKTIEDLNQNEELLTHHQILGLKYLVDFEKRIPRSEIEEIEKKIRENVCLVDSKYDITICGSYRRGKAESGDIDVLITHPDFLSTNSVKGLSASLLKPIVEKLKDMSLVIDTLSHGDVKYMGVCIVGEIARRIDIRLTPHDQYHCSTLYFTGSDMFNKEMRTHALQAGFTINEYCIRPMGATGIPGEALPVSSEEDVFDYIDFPYKKPSERG